MCLSLEQAISMLMRGETVVNPTDGARGDVEVAERAGTGDGALMGVLAKLSAAELSDAIDDPMVDEGSSRREDEIRTGLTAIISFSICFTV